MLKAAVKSSPQDNVRHRVVPPEAVAKMAEDLANLKQEVQEVLREEKEEKAVSTVCSRVSWRQMAKLTIMLSRSTAPNGRHGDSEGREHDRAPRRDHVPTGKDVVPDREGEEGFRR